MHFIVTQKFNPVILNFVSDAPVKKKKIGPGSVIEHAKYGRGTVLRLEGTGDDTKLTVSFPGYGLKKLIAKFAGIKVE